MKRLLAVLTLCLFLPIVAHAADPPPAPAACAPSTDALPADLTPRTALELLYYETAVCYRKKYLDAKSEVKSSTTSLTARNPEAIRAFAANACDGGTSDPVPYIISGTAGILVGGIAVWFITR